MAEAEDQEITAALARLAAQDGEAADEAGAALEWVVGGQSLSLVTQERIQTFCWYELPVKWRTSLRNKGRQLEWLPTRLLGGKTWVRVCRHGARC